MQVKIQKIYVVFLLFYICFLIQAQRVKADFIPLGNNSGIDTSTGIIWASPSSSPSNWKDALNFCVMLNFMGKQGWRLPDLRELISTINYSKGRPPFDPAFIGISPRLKSAWASTTYAARPDWAWGIELDQGNSQAWNKANGWASVFCVHDGTVSPPDSSIKIKITPNSTIPGGAVTLSFSTGVYSGQRDFYLYFYGSKFRPVWWNGTSWTTTMKSFGSFNSGSAPTASKNLNLYLPFGSYAFGAALVPSGAVFIPDKKYEANVTLAQAPANSSMRANKIGVEYDTLRVDWTDQPPIVTSITPDKTGPYLRGQSVMLTAVVSDPDQPVSDLYLYWEASGGAFVKQSADYTTVQWIAPPTSGNHTVTVFVGDGNGKTGNKRIQLETK